MSVAAERIHLRRVLLAVLGLCVSLFLQGVGFSTPGWIYAKGDSDSYHVEGYVGLWFMINCDKNNTCVRDTMPIAGRETQPETDIKYTTILEFQIFTSLALAFGIVAIVFGVAYRQCKKSKVPSLLLVCIFTSGLSGVLALIAAGKMGDINLQVHKQENEQLNTSVTRFPFSLFITGIGGLMDSIIAIFLIIEFHFYSRNGTSIQMRDEVNTGI